ncbi:hydrolase [Halorubrum gandharaense]
MSDASSPTVAACQTEVADLEPVRNLSRLRERVAVLPDRVDVALFPEYALTGFVDDEDELREVALTESFVADELSAAAREHGVAVLAGYVETGEGDSADDDAPLHNASTYVAPDGATTTYRKRHLWGAETDHLEPGTERAIVETAAGTTGLLTCYDLNFVAESAWFTERGVDALFVTGAWPAAHTANWRLLLRARALDGVRWVVGVGRTGEKEVGSGETTRYAGNSLVARPDGQVGAALGREPRDLVATLDQETLREQRALVDVNVG